MLGRGEAGGGRGQGQGSGVRPEAGALGAEAEAGVAAAVDGQGWWVRSRVNDKASCRGVHTLHWILALVHGGNAGQAACQCVWVSQVRHLLHQGTTLLVSSVEQQVTDLVHQAGGRTRCIRQGGGPGASGRGADLVHQAGGRTWCIRQGGGPGASGRGAVEPRGKGGRCSMIPGGYTSHHMTGQSTRGGMARWQKRAMGYNEHKEVVEW